MESRTPENKMIEAEDNNKVLTDELTDRFKIPSLESQISTMTACQLNSGGGFNNSEFSHGCFDGDGVQQPKTKLEIPTISISSIESTSAPPTTIVSHEWKTEAMSVSQCTTLSSMIPEKDAMVWIIKDFSAFRAAAKCSQIPPLMSPEFGGGCRLRLWLYEKNGEINGCAELPILKASRDGVAHFRIQVVRPDMKAIVTRKVEMKISHSGPLEKKTIAEARTSPSFPLTSRHYIRKPKHQHLVFGDCLRVRVEFEYFPFDSPVFRGFGKVGGEEGQMSQQQASQQRHMEMLADVRQYCLDDPSQNVEVKCGATVFNACRFLLCARSKRFREIFAPGISTARGSPSRYPRTNTSCAASLASITVQDVTAETLEQMIDFIHTDRCSWVDDRSSDILRVLDLLESASLYGVKTLVHLLVAHLSGLMDTENFMFMYDAAERIDDDVFKRICTEFMDSLPGSRVASLMRATGLGVSPRVA